MVIHLRRFFHFSNMSSRSDTFPFVSFSYLTVATEIATIPPNAEPQHIFERDCLFFIAIDFVTDLIPTPRGGEISSE